MECQDQHAWGRVLKEGAPRVSLCKNKRKPNAGSKDMDGSSGGDEVVKEGSMVQEGQSDNVRFCTHSKALSNALQLGQLSSKYAMICGFYATAFRRA